MFATQQRGNQAGAMVRASHEDQVESEETLVVGVPVTTGSASGVGGGGGSSQRRWERRRIAQILLFHGLEETVTILAPCQILNVTFC